jgi:hypothetical protein
MEFLTPVFERVRFLHGRISDRCCIQVDVGEDAGHYAVPAFQDLWRRVMRGFLKNAAPGEQLVFCPELLGTAYRYARCFRGADGKLREESDRWAQAAVLTRLAQACWAEATKSV